MSRSINIVYKTGILSKRWKHLWTSVPFLIFIDNHLVSDFVSLVNKTLTQCNQLKLKSFKLNASYNTRFNSEFNNWIRYAVSCHVEEINLSLCNTGNGTEFVFDQFFFINTCFTDLKLSGCIINLIGAISWKNLRSLRISHRKLDEELIENILSGSPLLETLVLEYCYGYRVLNITSQIVKKLVLFGYVDLDDHY
uniref:At1g61320/AtMIF1 LRR domain-containing protein n=1 Tax=Lactuca sativa TaxID=4236 RepID=A0A9R1X1B2_LACSA|nr:hypothetical protein LSAT_V11C700352170 [Lactuca sativa]